MGTFIFIIFIVYSVWICRMIVKRKNTNEKAKKIRTGIGVVIVNGLFFIAAFIFVNNLLTITTGEIYQATVTGIEQHNSGHLKNRRVRSSIVYAPVLSFQTESEGLIERTPSTSTNEKPIIGEKIEIYYSSFTKSIFVNSLGEYAFLCATALAFIVLLLLEWIFLSYALRGAIPVFLEPIFRKFRQNLFILILIAIALGISATLFIIIIQSVFINAHTQLSTFSIIICCLFAALAGTIGILLVRSLTKKKVSRQRIKKFIPSGRKR